MDKAAELLLLDLSGGDLGPQLDDPSQIVHGELRKSAFDQAFALGFQHVRALLDGGEPFLGLGGEIAQKKLGRLGLQRVELAVQILHLPTDGAVEVQIGRGFVDEVDGLVREISVSDVSLGQEHGLASHGLGDDYRVIGFVVVGHAGCDGDGILDGRLLHGHRLESTLESRILLDMLAILREGGGADDLDITAGKSGLEDIGGVHAALRVACAHDGVDLVDEQDDVAQGLDLVQEPLHAALHLATVLGPGHQGGHVQLPDLLVKELVGRVPSGDPLRQALHDGGLAHARLADETGIVLQPAVQDLHGPLQLRFPADEPVQLTGFRFGRQINTEGVQVLLLRGLAALTGLPVGSGGTGLLLRGGLIPLRSMGEKIPVEPPKDVVRASLADVVVVLVHVHELAAQQLVGLLTDGVQVLFL